MTDLKTFLVGLLLLGVAVALAWFLIWAPGKLHDLRVAKDAFKQTLTQKFLFTVLDLVDNFVQAQAQQLRIDLATAQADGKVTPDELKKIATDEWARIKTYFGPGYLETVAKALGLSLEGLGAIALQAISKKLFGRTFPDYLGGENAAYRPPSVPALK